MYEPPTRNGQGWNMMTPACPGGSCMFYTQGTNIGCQNASGLPTAVGLAEGMLHPCQKPTMRWRDQELGTYNLKGHFLHPMSRVDWTRETPWRAPGSAPMEDPCGLAGGWYTEGKPLDGARPPFGIPQGKKGSELPKLLKETIWVAGSTVEVAFGILANHGGGYQYRLCPAGRTLTEECFQEMPLEFVGNVQWLQYGPDGMDVNNRTAIPAHRVSVGTIPQGSTWTRNPIPACGDSPHGGACDEYRRHPHECDSSQFEPPAPGAHGFGAAACTLEPRDLAAHPKCGCSMELFKERALQFGIVDTVRAPVTPGEYVLQWRADVEQTLQVWSQCADVRVVAPGVAEPTKPFQRYDGCDSCCAATQGVCANCTACVDNKTGACEYCWTPLEGFSSEHIPVAQCLGAEDESGGAKTWLPGQDMKLWSPGCTKCWREQSCPVAPMVV